MSGARGRFDAALVSQVGKIAGHVAWEKVRKPRLHTARDVPRTPDDVSHEWLTAALCDGHPGAEVTDFEVLAGTSGTSTRRTIRVNYNDAGRDAGLPEHLYAKTMTSLTQRLMLGLTDIIRVEGFVYERVLPLLDVEVPRGYFAAFDPRSWRSIVITEDVIQTRGARFYSPQMEVTLDQMKDLLTAMATWHGTLWNHPVLEGGELQTTAERHAALSRFLDWGKRSEVGMRRAGEIVPPSVRAGHADVVRAFGRSMNLGSEGAMTLLHGDPHSAGNFYATSDGTMGWADWGVCLRGGWGYDYSYAVVGSLTIEQRREWERELLAHYLERLAEAGGEAPDFADAWLVYRQQLFYPYVGWAAVFGHGRFQPDSQPPEFCLPIIERAAHAIEDLDAVSAVLEQPYTERSIAR